MKKNNKEAPTGVTIISFLVGIIFGVYLGFMAILSGQGILVLVLISLTIFWVTQMLEGKNWARISIIIVTISLVIILSIEEPILSIAIIIPLFLVWYLFFKKNVKEFFSQD